MLLLINDIFVKKKLYYSAIVIIVLAMAAAGFIYRQKIPSSTTVTPVTSANYKNISYLIDGNDVRLINGSSKTLTGLGAGSETGTTTAYFGNEVRGDFNNDGQPDVAFLLTQDTGGSGTFFYVVAALGSKDGYVGTNAVLLGDRIAPQSTELAGNDIVVNYADRKPGEPMTATPSVGVTKYFAVDGSVLHEVSPGFSESDAKTIAEGACLKSGETLGGGSFNEYTKTWWFDANLKTTPAGCDPACVVSAETKQAAINWRCTGLKK